MQRFLSVTTCSLILLSAATGRAHAQDPWRAATGVNVVLPIAAGRDDFCRPAYRIGVGQRVGRQIAGARLAVEANIRAHVIATSAEQCVYAPELFPPPDGTYLVEDRPAPYLTTRFLAGDLRLRATLPLSSGMATVSLGHGRHWQDRGFTPVSATRPYWVAGAGLVPGAGPRWRLIIEGEYLVLRERFGRRRLTWAGGQLTGEEDLGTIREWLQAVGITVSMVVAF